MSDMEKSDGIGRRELLTAGSSAVMVGGLVTGYGTFFAMAARYLFPSRAGQAWLFVADTNRLAPGESMPFESPTGVKVTIKRRADAPVDQPPQVEDYLALSSICPHLGCRVHWEPHNQRFFCPCHNGVFDPEGNPVSGPPAADDQELPRYPLRVADGALYIEMPIVAIGQNA